MLIAKQSTAANLIVGPILDSTGAEYASAVIGDLSIAKHDATTLTALASAATLTYLANGMYSLVTTTGNMDTLGRVRISCNKSTYQMPPVSLMVVPATVYDAIVTNATNATGGLIAATATVSAVAGYVGASGAAVNGTNANTLSGHDPGATLGTSTLTQAQVTGGAYALNHASFAFASALDFTATQKAATLARVTLVDTTTSMTNTPTFNGPSAATIADAVLDEALAGHLTLGSFGYYVGEIHATGDLLYTDWEDGGRLDLILDARAAAATALSTATWTATRAGYLDNLSGGAVMLASSYSAPPSAATISTQVASDLAAAHGAGSWATATGFSTHSAADVVTAMGTGTFLSTIPWNAAWDAEVQSEAADALAAYDPPTNAEMEARTLLAAAYGTAANQSTIIGYLDTEVAAILAAVDTEVGAIKAKTDQLTFTVANQVDSNALSGGGSGLDAAGVRAAIGLASANLDTQLADIPTVAEFNARTLVAASYFDPAVDIVTTTDTANVTAILADTNELQSDWVNGGRLDLILDARASQTSVDDVPTNAELATALGTADDAVLSAIAALNNLSAAQVNTECDTALTDAGVTTARMAALADWIDGGRLDLLLDAILDDTGTAGVALSAAICNKVADHVRRRTQANVEASSDGDTLSKSSQYGAIQQIQRSNTTDTAGLLTIKKTDGTTLGTLTLTSDAAGEPLTGVS